GAESKVTTVRLNELRLSDELAGKTIRAGGSLFPRLDPKEVLKKMDSLSELKSAGNAETPAPAPSTGNLAPQITIDDFSKIDLRVATVVEAERVKGADK